MPFELHVALRYLLAKRKQAFISVISLISTIGVSVGVMALVIAGALMTGLQGELRDRILGATPHVFVFKPSGIVDYREEARKLLQMPHVVGAAPAILGKALVSAAGSEAFIDIKGIDPGLEPSVTAIASAMRTGAVEPLANPDPSAPNAVLLGSELAAHLGVSVGDQISVTTPHGTLTPNGIAYIPRPLTVAGTFNLGLTEIDSQTGFVSIPVGKRLFGKDYPDAIQLKLDDIWSAPDVSNAITEQLGVEYLAQDWQDINRSLFNALWLEQVAVSLTIALIVMVAALNIVASLILLVMEKHRDIGILKTMGASARSVTVIFILQGMIIGVIGTVAGAVLGAAVSVVMDRYKLVRVPADVYQVPYMPFKVESGDVLLVTIGAIVICFLATIYPSWQAARLDPAQALRYE